jgi:peptidoglycan-associated lipoprotein
MAPRRAPTLLALAFSSLAVASLALLGCDAPGFKSKAKSPTDAAKGAAVGQTTTTSAQSGGPNAAGGKQNPAVWTPGLTVSDMIAQACGIPPRAPGKGMTPSFEYDSAALGDTDRQMLSEVAKCLTEGALKGKAVALVGRADARGEPEYNMTLGESRADAVQRYLVDLGVGKDRLKATSRGEMDATGTNEEGWAQDRRVDIELVM